jgi:hypothetical protein
MHVADITSKEQMLREILLWASEVIKNKHKTLRLSIIILIFANGMYN